MLHEWRYLYKKQNTCIYIHIIYTLYTTIYPYIHTIYTVHTHEIFTSKFISVISYANVTFLLNILNIYSAYTTHKPRQKCFIIVGNGSQITSHQIWQQDTFKKSTKLPNKHISHNPIYCMRGSVFDTELISAHGKAFPLGNLIICTHQSVPVFLFNLHKFLNEMTAIGTNAWPSAITVLP